MPPADSLTGKQKEAYHRVTGIDLDHPEATPPRIAPNIQQCIEVWKSTEKWTQRAKENVSSTHKIPALMETRPSSFSDKKEVRVSVRMPNLTCGSLERVILDDPENTDAKTTNVYKYDDMLAQRTVLKEFDGNTKSFLTRYKSPIWGVKPREILTYVTPAARLNAEQQALLGVRSIDAAFAHDGGEEGHQAGGEAKKRELFMFVQCGVHCPEEDGMLPPEMASKKHQRGVSYIYTVVGLEQADRSLLISANFAFDPCGSVPATLVDHAQKSQLKRIKVLAELAAAQGPQESMLRVYENRADFKPYLSQETSV